MLCLSKAHRVGRFDPNTAVINNPEYEYYQNEILYPSNADEMNTEYFYDIDIETRTYYEKLWEEILLAD